MVLVVGKAVVGLGLLIALGLAVWLPAPRRAPSAGELRGLLGGVALLYAAAAAACVLHRALVAEAACALGVMLSALAGWLSRGDDDDLGAGAPDPIDWRGFDRARRGWERPPIPASRR